MSKPNKLIPELRFPEFKNEEEWEIKNESVKILSGNSYVMSDYSGTGVRLVQGANIFNGQYSDEYSIYISDDKSSIQKHIIINKGDLLLGLNRPITNNELKVCLYPYDIGYLYQRAGKLIYQDDIFGLFLYQFLCSTLFLAGLKKELVGSDQPYIKSNLFANDILIAPSLKEQQKIASCLSSIDEVIAAHSQKLELLKDHKKSLMQNLFPKGDEKVPKYRFKEFEKDGAWIKETVGDVYDFKVTNSLAREYLNYENGTVKNIHYGDIHTKFNTLFDITKEDVPYINTDVSIEKIRKECYCVVGDIVFADASEDMNDVGKSIEIVNLNKEKLVSGLHTLLARQKEKKLAIGFGGYLFKSDWVRKQIQREAQGAKVLGISVTRISNVQILYPKNHKEQEAISLCLSSLDEIITAQAEKIEQLKLHKKGLMQVLFPKITD